MQAPAAASAWVDAGEHVIVGYVAAVASPGHASQTPFALVALPAGGPTQAVLAAATLAVLMAAALAVLMAALLAVLTSDVPRKTHLGKL